MKKFLSLILSIAMLAVLVASALPVYAEEALPTGPFVNKDTGKEFTTLADALASVTDTTPTTFYMTADYTGEGGQLGPGGGKTITIEKHPDLDRTPTLSYTNTTAAAGNRALQVGNCTFTFRNLNILFKGTNSAGGLNVVDANAHIILDNVTYVADGANYPLLESHWSGGKYTIKNHSVVTSTHSSFALLRVANGTNISFELDETSTLNYSSNYTGGTFQFYGALAVIDSTLNATINGTMNLISGNRTDAAFFATDGGAATCTITLGNTAVLKWDTGKDANNYAACNFVHAAQIADHGATYILGENVTGKVTFPTVLTESGEPYGGFVCGGTMVANGGNFEKKNARQMIFRATSEEAPSMLENVNGVAIRTDGSVGIRFTAKVNQDVYENLMAEKEESGIRSIHFGMMIAPKNKYVKNVLFTEETITGGTYNDGVDYLLVGGLTAEQITDGIYQVAVTCNALEMAYESKIVACAYYEIEYEDGTISYVFADFDHSVMGGGISVFDVAKAYYEDTESGSKDNANINAILDACGYNGSV